MTQIFKSASRIAFLALIFTSCAGFLLGKLSMEMFVPIVMAGAGAYFVAKGKEVTTPNN